MKAEREKDLPCYREYRLSKKELFSIAGLWTIVSVCISFLFYRSFLPMMFFLALFPLVLKPVKKKFIAKRKEMLSLQFCDGMSAYALAIGVGYSPENGISQALIEIERIHGKESLLAKEFALIKRKLSLGESIENCIVDFSKRSDIEEAKLMAGVFAIAKRNGGYLPDILRSATRMLEEKSRLGEEIKTLMSAKRLEHRIMCIMPAGILAYINLSGYEFVAPLYSGFAGRIIMTVAILIYALLIYLGERIMKTDL